MVIACLVIPIVLCIFLAIVPIMELIAMLTGYDFILYSQLVIPIIQTVLSIGAVVALYYMKAEFGRTETIFGNLLTPVALLNALYFVNSDSIAAVIMAVIWTVCAFIIYLKFVPDSGFKATSAVFSVLLALAFVGLFLVVNVIGGLINTKTVNDTIESPDGSLAADICTVGAILGDKTEITVRHTEPKAKVLIGYYAHKEVLVYSGEDHEAQTATVHWLDDDTIMINSNEYTIGENE